MTEDNGAMLTPRQQKYWDEFQTRPLGKELVERLGLEVIESEEFKRNKKINERAQMIIDQIELAPKMPRRIIKARLPWDPVDLSWVKPGNCPF